MPVSPQDFALYSRMTGAPVPTDAATRMQMAPDVYKFTKDFAKKPNILEKSGNLLKNIAKTTLMGAAGLAAAPGLVEQQQTTADRVNQDTTENQTARKVVERKGTQYADSQNNKTIAQDVTEDQYLGEPMFRPTRIPTMGALHAATPIVGEGLSKSGNEINVIKGEEEEVVGSGATSDKVQEFLKKMGGTDEESKLDAVLLGAIGDRYKKERFYAGGELHPDDKKSPIKDNSPLTDHPDTVGGEDDNKLPGVSNFTGAPRGTVISPSTKLSPSSDELDSILSKALANKTPQERETVKQQMLRNMNASREGFMAQDGPNRPAFEAKKRILEKTGKEREARIVGAPNVSDKANNFLAMVQEMKNVKPSELRSDIQIGGLQKTRKDGSKELGKSVGMSLMPNTVNGGDAVAFTFMNDPTKPEETTTKTFSVTPEALQELQSGEGDLGSASFGQRYNMALRGKGGFGSLPPTRFAGGLFLYNNPLIEG